MKAYRKLFLRSIATAVAIFSTISGSQANPIVWTDWNTDGNQDGYNGTVIGWLGAIEVTYTGETVGPINDPVDNNNIATWTNGTFLGWWPHESFAVDGLDDTPDTIKDIIIVHGDDYPSTHYSHIHFSMPVKDPYFAVWSLGTTPVLSGPARMDFDLTPTFIVGGPACTPTRVYPGKADCTYYDSQSIYVQGNTVYGTEGNGVVRFYGEVTDIVWTNSKEYEGGYYGFTVGVPEPSGLALLGLGLTMLNLRLGKRAQASD